jgi:hypothetical protein
MRGLHVSIYRNARWGDASNGGVSGKAESALLVGPGIPEIFAESEGVPVLKLVRRNIGGEYLHAEPVVGKDATKVGYMFGGNFIYTSDSRFPNRYPIPTRDARDARAVRRIESLKQLNICAPSHGKLNQKYSHFCVRYIFVLAQSFKTDALKRQTQSRHKPT